MKSTLRYLTSALVAGGMSLSLVAGPLARPAAADDFGSTVLNAIGGKGGGHQGEKNAMRNLGIGLGAAAAYMAIKGKTTNALILGAGAAYSAKKYEDARKAQNKENAYQNDRWYDNEYRSGFTPNGARRNGYQGHPANPRYGNRGDHRADNARHCSDRDRDRDRDRDHDRDRRGRGHRDDD